MKVRNTIKKVAALAAGTSMVAATIMGATATGLEDYPAPFVQNGVFNGKLVIGESAAVQDVLGAIDIATSLQAAAKVPVSSSGSSSTVSVSGGVEIASGSDKLNFDEMLNSLNAGTYDEDDFEDLLKKGTVEDDDGSDTDYEQQIVVGNARVQFAQDDDYSDDPIFHVDLDAADTKYLQFDVEFDQALDITALDDSETIFMFGKQFTFDPNHTNSSDLTFFGSDVIVTVGQDEPVTIEVDGQEYTLTVLGGNSDNSEVILQVTGQGTETKTLQSGNSRTMAGLELFIDDVFISNIGESTVSASVFVGSNKVVIDSSAVSTTSSYVEIDINDEDSEIEAWVDGNGLASVDNIHFRIDPTDFIDPNTGDDFDWLTEGDEFVDELFGFGLSFESFSPAIEGRDMVELRRTGDAYSLEFSNNDGEDIEFELYQVTSGSLALGEDLVLSGTQLVDDNIFILEEDNTNREDTVTKVYEVQNINGDSGDEEVTLKDLGSGTTKKFDLNDEIDDTGATISAIASDDSHFNISSAVVAQAVFKGGANATFDTNTSGGYTFTYYEDSDDLDDVSTAGMFNLSINTGSALSVSDEDIALTNAAWQSSGNATVATDTGSDVRYGVSLFGTWFEQESDNSGDYLKVYNSEHETSFNVFLNGPDAIVVTTGGSTGGSAYQLNEFVVGQIAIYDSEAMGMIGSTPLISVGGPCANTVSMQLMGNPEVCYEGFTQGKGLIKFFESQNALMVAGYSADDTVGASYVLADYMSYAGDLMGDEVEVVVTDLENLEVNPLQ